MKNSKKKIGLELDAITYSLHLFSKGASIEQIKSSAGLDIEIRTLQRRLAKLQDQGKIVISGNARATLYHLAHVADVYEEAWIVREDEATYSLPFSLTREAEEVRSLILLPIKQRTPIGYNPAFLHQYKPNIDYYLSEKEKDKLATIGKTASLNQPAGTYAKEILNRLLIDLSFNSSRLEGNTYSLLDTERLISIGEAAEHKSIIEAQMILNHKDAIEFLVQTPDDIGFNRYAILNLHALLSNNLLPNPAASGRLRTFSVGIHHSVFTPLAIPQQIDELFDLFLQKASQIHNPFEQAFFTMVHLPYLQPFDDVNKRVSRLAANIPLNHHNLSPLSFVDVPNDLYIQGIMGVYELNRTELLKDVFLYAYERSAARYAMIRQSLGEPDLFRLTYREQIRTLITFIITNTLSSKQAAAKIKLEARQLSKAEQPRFIEIVETELLALHEGNFARYWIRPSEFRQWKKVWETK